MFFSASNETRNECATCDASIHFFEMVCFSATGECCQGCDRPLCFQCREKVTSLPETCKRCASFPKPTSVPSSPSDCNSVLGSNGGFLSKDIAKLFATATRMLNEPLSPP